MPDEQRESVDFLVQHQSFSDRQACRAVKLPRATFQYKPIKKDDKQIISFLSELSKSIRPLDFGSAIIA